MADWRAEYLRRSLRRLGKRPPRRLPRALYPERLEAQYARTLDKYVVDLKNLIDKRVKPLLPGLVEHYGRVRTDAENGEIRKYYLAFLYDKSWANPDLLHCTHKYLGELTRAQVRDVEQVVDAYFITPRDLPRISFTRVQHFGPENDIRVLTPEPSVNTASLFMDLRNQLTARFGADTFPEFKPHVTTDLESIDEPFTCYALISKGGIDRTWPKSVRLDADDDLGALADQLEKARIEINQAYTPQEIERLAKYTGESVATWNARQLNGQLRGIVEIDLFGNGGERWLLKEMSAFVVQNVGLIESIGAEYLSQVQRLISTSVMAGERVEQLSSDLESRFQVARSRANLIARDQVGKFNGQLTEARQTDLGIDGYTWRDSGDARVRPEHHLSNGEKYKWNSPPPQGHPGEDFQCRCGAEPDLAKFFE